MKQLKIQKLEGETKQALWVSPEVHQMVMKLVKRDNNLTVNRLLAMLLNNWNLYNDSRTN